MYHYLKWAALSLFIKRKLKFIAIILFSLIGLYMINGIYSDLVDYAIAIDKKRLILFFLIGKWSLVIIFLTSLIYGVFKLVSSKDKKGKSKKQDKEAKQESINIKEEIKAKKESIKEVIKKSIGAKDERPKEEILKERLSKFEYNGKPLRRRSDILIEELKRR